MMASQHSMLDRQALLLRAWEPLTDEDRALLQVRLCANWLLCLLLS